MARQDIKKILLKFSEKLLTLNTRNKLLSSTFSTRSESFMFIDELPQQLATKLASGMEFIPLPPIESEPPDEKNAKFKNKVAEFKLIDEDYLKAISKINDSEITDQDDQDKIADLELKALRKLKNKVRDYLGLMPLSGADGKINLTTHAKLHKINPSYDLPDPSKIDIDSAQYNDNKIQTLFIEEDLNARLAKLKQKFNSNLQETGLQTAYICFGFLEWNEVKNSKKRLAPLMMLPVEFGEDRKDFSIRSIDNEILDNKTLRMYLEADFRIKLPKFPVLKSDSNETHVDIEKYLKKINNYVEKRKGWRVLRRASIGIFYTQDLTIHEDLKELAEDPNELLNDLLSGKPQESSDTVYEIDDSKFQALVPSLIEPADSSQHSAVIDMINSKSFVLRGPPGTGKSQTICNMIAAGISSGKKILFIADKEAALEVVRSRLTSAGISPYLLKAYGKKSSKKEFWDSIKTRFKFIANNHKEEYFQRTLQKLQDTKKKLNEYKEFIGSTYGESSLTNHDLLWQQESLAEDFSLDKLSSLDSFSPKLINDSEVENSQNILAEISNAFDPEYIDHPWASSKKPPKTPVALKDFKDACHNFRENLERFNNNYENQTLVIDPTHEAAEKTCSLYKAISTGISDIDDCQNKALFDYVNGSENERNKIELVIRDGISIFSKKAEFSNMGFDVERLAEISKCGEEACEYLYKNSSFNEIITRLDEYENAISFFQYIANSDIGKNIFTLEQIHLLIKIRDLFAEIPTNFKDKLLFSNSFLTLELVKKLKLLHSVCNQKAEFKEQKIEIDEDFREARDYKNAALVFNEAHIFSFLSGDFWKARKLFSSITEENKSNQEKAKILLNIARYLRDKEIIKNDTDIAGELGIHFKGDETDIETVAYAYDLVSKLWDLKLEVNLSKETFYEIQKNPSYFFKTFIPNIPYSDQYDLSAIFESIDFSQHPMQICEELNKDLGEISKLQKLINDLQLNDKKVSDILDIEGDIRLFEEQKELFLNKANSLFSDEMLKHIGANNLTKLLDHLTLINNRIVEMDGDVKVDKKKFDNNHSVLVDLHQDLSHLVNNYNELVDLIDANPIEDIKQTPLSTLEIFAKKTKAVESNIDAFFQFKNYESALQKDYEKDFYNSYKNAFSDEINNLPGFFLAWVRNEQYKDLTMDPDNQLLIDEFRGTKLNRLQSKLKKLDEEIQELTRHRVAELSHEVSFDAPLGNSSNKVSEKTESELLTYGITKKTFPRGSIREHIFKTAEALSCYSPCWMMTPANVSTFLPRKELFDLVIIDEASQMTPAKAFGAIGRSRQLIVVGDENQLPPTSFFQKSDSDIEEDLDMDADESILDLALGVWRNPRMLMWHYRSRHEDLIRFQNNFIYESKLIIPPSVLGGASEDFGVKNHFLDEALYLQGGSNNDEADKIIKLLVDHAELKPNKSIGVAVMNITQSELVKTKINQELVMNKTLAKFIDYWDSADEGLNRFFVKNLENVQGDERDVIIVGTVYGRNRLGERVLQRFPTINTATGHRRLNVITTRARDQIHVVTSLRSSDIHEKNNRGKAFLAEYLDYSISKNITEGSSDSLGGTDSPFEDWAVTQVKNYGFEPVTQVGVRGFKIDIGVKHPDVSGYILGIECDGATYHSSPSARDRDYLRQSILESSGWNLHRIWSTDWIWDPRKTRDTLHKALERALAQKKKDLTI